MLLAEHRVLSTVTEWWHRSLFTENCGATAFCLKVTCGGRSFYTTHVWWPMKTLKSHTEAKKKDVKDVKVQILDPINIQK